MVTLPDNSHQRIELILCHSAYFILNNYEKYSSVTNL